MQQSARRYPYILNKMTSDLEILINGIRPLLGGDRERQNNPSRKRN
jgi:hypothetical protein